MRGRVTLQSVGILSDKLWFIDSSKGYQKQNRGYIGTCYFFNLNMVLKINVKMDNKIFVLYSASYMDWKPVGKFKSLEELKKKCVDDYGFPEEILEDDEEFDEHLDGYEMKYEVI